MAKRELCRLRSGLRGRDLAAEDVAEEEEEIRRPLGEATHEVWIPLRTEGHGDEHAIAAPRQFDLPPLAHAKETRTVSVTIGIATSEAGQPEGDLFVRADRALYEGKRSGRGQVRVS